MKTLYDANDKPILSEADKLMQANFALAAKMQGSFEDLYSKAAAMHPRMIYGPDGQALPRITSQHASASAMGFRIPFTFLKADTE